MSETIAALATPPGRGAIAIVRVSGPDVRAIAARIVPSVQLRPRYAHYSTIVDESGEEIDRGVAIFSAQPHSYTGEDTLELQIHGSPVVARECCAHCSPWGAARRNQENSPAAPSCTARWICMRPRRSRI